jgi:hypothetical protein
MPVSLVRRFAVLLILSVAAFGIFKCTYYYTTKHQDVFCPSGNGSPSRPMICVDERTLTASPHHAKVYDVEAKSDGHTRSDRPVVIQWYTQKTADLKIKFIDDCMEKVDCDGIGNCSAKVKIRLKKGDKPTTCRYSMTLGATKFDPEDDIVVNPCCW